MKFSRSRRLSTILAIPLVGGLVALALSFPAAATPVCPDDRTACGGRIFPEAQNSADFVQHGPEEYEPGIKALERDHKQFVRVRTLADHLNDPKAVSVNGHPIWVIEITNFNVPERKKIPIAVSLSVHGPERAGLEGGVRYMEDLATWADTEPNHILRNGTNKDSTKITVADALRKVHLYISNLNPDGWEAGDNPRNVYIRGNGNFVDLNREFPTMGWVNTSYTPLSEPESKAWHKLLRRIKPVAATDIHGEITSANNAFADLMLPAGQWNPREQAQEERLARHMKSNVARYFKKDGVELGDVTGASDTMKPSDYATGYDVVGYDDSGFMGDYFTQWYGALEMDVEHFVSHLVPGGMWIPSLEEAHVAAVRGEIEALLVEAIVHRRVRVKLSLGKVGYLFDPRVVKSSDGYGGPPPPKGYDPMPYRATRMRYFKDLSRFSEKRFRKVLSGDVARGGLRGLDTFIMANKSFPRDPRGRKVRHRRFTRVVEDFVKGGGNLILTDRSVKFLSRLGIVGRKTIRMNKYNAGHVDIEDFSDPYTRGVHHTASQTYYEVGLGYSADADASPHWTVARRAWRKAGGKTVAHITEENRVGLGRVKLGKGTVGIFGAVLPNQNEKEHHFYGLADYAVTVAAGQILNNMIRLGR